MQSVVPPKRWAAWGVVQVLDWLDAKRRDASAKLMAAVKPRRRLLLQWR